MFADGLNAAHVRWCWCYFVYVSMLYSPVLIMPGFEWNQVGSTRPLKVEKPRIRRFLEEFKSTYCKKRNEIKKKQTLSMHFIRWSCPDIKFYNNEMKMYDNSLSSIPADWKYPLLLPCQTWWGTFHQWPGLEWL